MTDSRMPSDPTRSAGDYIDIVFDRPPGPEAPRLIEVEDASGRSIRAGEWLQREDGYWVLRISGLPDAR